LISCIPGNGWKRFDCPSNNQHEIKLLGIILSA
jgi:hypothetical protein